MSEELYKLQHGRETILLAPQTTCLCHLARMIDKKTTVAQLEAQGWRIVPARRKNAPTACRSGFNGGGNAA